MVLRLARTRTDGVEDEVELLDSQDEVDEEELKEEGTLEVNNRTALEVAEEDDSATGTGTRSNGHETRVSTLDPIGSNSRKSNFPVCRNFASKSTPTIPKLCMYLRYA